MKHILTVCAQGNNRSVMFAVLLRYKYKCDTIPVGVDTFSPETLDMLYKWADVIICVQDTLRVKIPEQYQSKVKLWNVGPDTFPRPYNPMFKILVDQFI